MRTRFTNTEIGHEWFRDEKGEREGRANNMLFANGIIFSYGHHFPIAKIVFNKRGEKGVLFTSRSYSNSTWKHIVYTRRAIGYQFTNVFSVGSPTMAVTDVQGLYAERVAVSIADLDKAKTAETKAKEFGELRARIKDYDKWAVFIGSKKRAKMPARFQTDEFKAYLTRAEKITANRRTAGARAQETKRAKQAEEWKARAEWNAKTQADKIAEWIANAPNSRIPYGTYAFLRISAKQADTVETSQGVTIPIEHAIRVAKLYARLVTSRVSQIAKDTLLDADAPIYKRNGHTIHLGHYALDSISADGTINAGCHTITRDEVERFTAVLKGRPEWTATPPARLEVTDHSTPSADPTPADNAIEGSLI